MYASRKDVPLLIADKVCNENWGERKGKIVVFFFAKKYVVMIFFVSQHSTENMNKNKYSDGSIYISVYSLKDLRLSLLCN